MSKGVKRFVYMFVGALIMIIASMLIGLYGCSPINPPDPTATPVPPTSTPSPTPPPFEEWGWWDGPVADYPREVDGEKVCYIRVSERGPLLYEAGENSSGVPIFEIYGKEVKDRIIYKENKILMVRANGNIFRTYDFIENDTNACRPFRSDGGNHVYWLMDEQVVDGHIIGDVEAKPLFIRVKAINEELVLP